MKEYKTLKSFKNFDVIEMEGHERIKMTSMSVAVMPFTVDDQNMLSKIGLLKEYNTLREGDFCHTLITGTIENEDDDLLSTAKRELSEEGGFTTPPDENVRWVYLGNFFPYKDSDRQVPTFAVDVTGLSKTNAAGDGSKKEMLSELIMMPVNEIMVTEEALALAAFLRLFNYFYLKSTGHV